MLAGCGFADIRSPVPEFMRAKAAEPPPLEAPPNVKQLLSEKLDAVFTATSYPAHVRVSQPLHDPRGGLSWTACVRAEVTAVTGKPIAEGVISDRRRVEGDDTCDTENYEPI